MRQDSASKIELPRVFAFHHYLALSLGYAIGLGWIVVPARMLARGGPLTILSAIVLSGILLWLISRCYKMLIQRYAAVGGEMVFARTFAGNGVAFLVFWLLLLGYLSYVLFYTSFSGVIFESLLPALTSTNLLSIGDHDLRASSVLPGLAICGVVLLANCVSTKAALTLQTLSIIALIAIVVGVAIVGFVHGSGSNVEPIWPEGQVTTSFPTLLVVVTGMICWYIFGFSTIAQCSGESREPGPNTAPARALAVSLLLTTVFYLLVHSFVIVALPWQQVVTMGMPTAEVLQSAFGFNWAYQLILVAGVLGIVTTVNVCIICATRLLVSASRSGFVPAVFGRISGRGVPRNAILSVALFGLVGPFLALSWLVTDLGPISFVCAFVVTCAIAIGRSQSITDRVISYAGLLVSLILGLSMLVPGAYYYVEWPTGYLLLAALGVVGFAAFRTGFARHSARPTVEEL